MLVDLWEQVLNFLDRQDIINILKSKVFVSSDRLICNICSYRKSIHISDNIYVLEYIFDYCGGKYNLKSSTCGIYLNGICDHCSKVRGKLKFSQSAFNFHNLKDYLQMEQLLLISKNKKLKYVNKISKEFLSERVAAKYT